MLATNSVVLEFPGAVSCDAVASEEYRNDRYVPHGVASHYGSPLREERDLREGRACVDLSYLEILEVRGEDRLSWLSSLTTQDLTALMPGDSTELLLLSPQGHVENAAGVIEGSDSTFLVTEPGWGSDLAGFLTSMVFMMRAEVILREDLAAAGAYGEAVAVLERCEGCTLVWRDPWPLTSVESATYGPRDDEHPGRELQRSLVVVPRASLGEFVGAALASGLSLAGLASWEAVRVASWRPSMAEVDSRTLPHELDWLRTAVHLHKGCYRGQETVAKLVNLGRPPRRLVYLYLEGPADELPQHGDSVLVDGRNVGVVTSASRTWEDGPVALALVRRNVDLDAVLDVGNFRASQTEIVRVSGKSSVSPESRPGEEFRRSGVVSR